MAFTLRARRGRLSCFRSSPGLRSEVRLRSLNTSHLLSTRRFSHAYADKGGVISARLPTAPENRGNATFAPGEFEIRRKRIQKREPNRVKELRRSRLLSTVRLQPGQLHSSGGRSTQFSVRALEQRVRERRTTFAPGFDTRYGR